MAIDLDRDQFRKNLLKYTRQAFEAIPVSEKPLILDLGCGSGVQTIELAKLSGGHVSAVDIDPFALEKVRLKAVEENLESQIDILQESIKDLSFLRQKFDIIWAEGSIYVVGFESGLTEWRKHLVSGGHLAIHDDARNTPQKLRLISKCGYEVTSYFEISYQVWWEEYYQPLELYIDELLNTDVSYYNIRNEIKQFKKSKAGSTFFVIRKI